ncbi:complexed with cef1p [Blastocladiella emersonii ATCC 22665]|nr:complexed with cef1p [Blastocladiella emersonii ATCC 22665]
MTTAARPTFNPAMGGHTGRDLGFKSRIISNKEQAGYTKIKYRQRGQNSQAEIRERNLQEQLQKAERAFAAKKRKLLGTAGPEDEEAIAAYDAERFPVSPRGPKTRDDGEGNGYGEGADLDPSDRSPKRARKSAASPSRGGRGRRPSAAAAGDDPDADMVISDSEAGSDADKASSDEEEEEDASSSDDDDDDSEDETEALMRELEKIKRERAEERERQEQARRDKEDAEREEALLTSNPLLQLGGAGPGGAGKAKPDFSIKKRWDDDVVFKNQARVEDKPQKRFINDTIRSDFHRRFLSKYVQ